MEATVVTSDKEFKIEVNGTDTVAELCRKAGISMETLSLRIQGEAPQPAASAEASEAADTAEEEDDPEKMEAEVEAPPPQPEGDPSDFETAAGHKESANSHKASGDWTAALDAYTNALTAQKSALTFANRADCLLKLKRPIAAIIDCDKALEINPDSAKALKIKGKSLRFLCRWEEALQALSKAMSIDFDPDLQEMLNLVKNRVKVANEKKNADTAEGGG